MKIAVIGGGIFGISVALRLSREGYHVELLEQNGDILQAASGSNQYRLHRGYHYPRSFETSQSALAAEAHFRAEYGDAVVDHNDHFYGIAKEGSKVDAGQFQDFCKRCDLEYEVVKLPLLNEKKFQLVVKVKEALFDPKALYAICKKKLDDSLVQVKFNTTADEHTTLNYDYTVNCTYANLNSILHSERHTKKNYQFELCEKPVLRLPVEYRRTSIVVLDGPFMCIDPIGDSDLHVMGNVVHALHVTHIGKHLVIPEKYIPFLNKGIVPPQDIAHITHIKQFIENSKHYIPGTENAEHVGSMFTVRTVLPNLDKTDARPTLVEDMDDRLITVFSGKIGNSVVAADEVVALIRKKIARS